MKPLMTAVGGSAADPPHLGHLAVLEKLRASGLFDRIIWAISGDRLDKYYHVHPNDRIAMTELMIPREMRAGGNPDLVVMYDDIHQLNTPTITLLSEHLPQQYPDSKFYWFTGSDSVVPRDEFDGECEIEARWVAGSRLYREFPFVIIERVSFPLNGLVLPRNFSVLPGMVPEISSSGIRILINSGQPFEHLLTNEVADYIKRHGLYGYKEKRS